MSRRYSGSAMRNLGAFSREIIRPSVSAASSPHHPRRYNLSPMDQTIFRNYMPFVFFYPTGLENVSEISRRLKNSFAETLAAYYPFAGRLMNSEACVDCNDEGAEFQESRIECVLSEFVKKYEEDLDLDLVFPPNSMWKTFDNSESPLIVRVNYFDCGGIAIAICMTHIIGDGATLTNFMNYWAAVTRQSGDQESPHIISSPSCNDNFEETIHPIQRSSVPSARFMFMNSELVKLKAKVRSSDGQNPTRFEFVSGLIYKCFTSVDNSRSGSFKPSILYHPVNVRSKLIPPLPKTTIGNWIWRDIIKTRTESDLSWKNLLDEIKTAKKLLEGMKDLDVNELNAINGELTDDKFKMYCFASACNSDMYKVNFGWGNPIRIGSGPVQYSGNCILLDTPCGNGIEVLMAFGEPNLLKLKLNQEIDALA